MYRQVQSYVRFLKKRELFLFTVILIIVVFQVSNAILIQASLIFSDNFNDNEINKALWEFGVLGRSSSQNDPKVQVSEENGRLIITPRSQTSGRSYNGYISVNGYDLTNSNAVVEIVEAASSKAETMFSIGIDEDNFYRFRAKGSTLYLQYAKNGSTSTSSIRFNTATHRFWRFRHLAQSNEIVLETSSDAADWTVRRKNFPEFDITNVNVGLTAGTSASISSPRQAQFDNFVFSTNGNGTPTPTPTVTPTPTPTATPTPTPTVTPTPSPVPNPGNARGYLTTPNELAQIKLKSANNVEPYKSAVSALLSEAGSPSSWSIGTVNPTNRDQLKAAAAKVYAKAMAYHLTGDSGYAITVRQKILEISTTDTCSNTYSGGNGCILTLSRHISGYIAAADLISDYSGWTASDKQTFQIWLRDEVYRFTDWASDARSTNWGSVGSATTLYIADYFAGSGLSLIDRDGRSFTAHQAYVEARQRAIDRNNGNSYMYNSVCSNSTGLGIQYYGGIPEETGRDSTGCWGTYLLTNDSSWSYMIAHLSGTIMSAELLLRRGDSILYDNIQADGSGSILRAILYVIENPYDPSPPDHWFDWLESRKSILEIAYRYYRHPAMARQLGVRTGSRHIAGDGNSAMPHFGTLTHGFANSENPDLPPVTPAP